MQFTPHVVFFRGRAFSASEIVELSWRGYHQHRSTSFFPPTQIPFTTLFYSPHQIQDKRVCAVLALVTII